MGLRGKKNHKRRKRFSCHKELKDMGFVLLVFGLITICAFFFSVRVWILLLGCVFVVCGIKLYCK